MIEKIIDLLGELGNQGIPCQDLEDSLAFFSRKLVGTGLISFCQIALETESLSLKIRSAFVDGETHRPCRIGKVCSVETLPKSR